MHLSSNPVALSTMEGGFQEYEEANSSVHHNEFLWGSSDDAAFISSDASFGMRVFITVVYSVVCLLGLLGNGLVMYLIRTQKGRSTPIINIFIFGLAVADFQFSLMLPFWAAETALDFLWPFGEVLCKIVPSLTITSIYANVSLLTAMSVTRYWTLASALKAGSTMTPNQAKWIIVALWALALGAAVPTVIFMAMQDIDGVQICLFRFPTGYGLGIYRLHRVVFTFVIPLGIISVSYFLLLRLLKTCQVNGSYSKRQKHITTTIRLVIGEEDVMPVVVPLSPSENPSKKPEVDKENHTLSSLLELRTKETKLTTKAQLIPGSDPET
uniref:Uncharacterized protein n=1 Tax=Sphaerodactylus townsendi TaxID=933632 RepID=A0ACB8G8W2_9SAUR